MVAPNIAIKNLDISVQEVQHRALILALIFVEMALIKEALLVMITM